MNCETADRVKEVVAIMMIGDGVLAAIDPLRHARLWENGPSWWRAMISPFVRRPALTRWLGIGETLGGVWLASRQRPEAPRA